MITVEEAMGTKAFEEAKVVGGSSGLTRNISQVTVAEVPDAANWLQGGEIVCTTAYFISKEVKYQINWIESLSFNGAVALAIKTDRFLGTIPESIIDVANKLNFPVIEMPPATTWPAVIESIMNPLMYKQIRDLKRAEEIHNKLTSLVLEDESVKIIADEISALVENPIIIEDARLNLIAVGERRDEEKDSYKKIIQKRLSQSLRKKINDTYYYQDVLRNRNKANLQIYIDDENTINSIMAPILSNKMIYGFITVIEVNKYLSEIDLIAIKHGASALALQLMKQIIHKQTAQNKYIALIDDLVHGRIHTEVVNEYRIRNKN